MAERLGPGVSKLRRNLDLCMFYAVRGTDVAKALMHQLLRLGVYVHGVLIAPRRHRNAIATPARPVRLTLHPETALDLDTMPLPTLTSVLRSLRLPVSLANRDGVGELLMRGLEAIIISHILLTNRANTFARES